MNIILMRHGEAIPFVLNDAERPLTAKGKADTAIIGSHLRKSEWSLSTIFCSTRSRAQQTAEVLMDSIRSEHQVKVLEGITPEDDWRHAMAVIERHMLEGAIFVFHQPILTAIVGFLTEADANFDVRPRALPATAYHLRLAAVLPGMATLAGGYQP